MITLATSIQNSKIYFKYQKLVLLLIKVALYNKELTKDEFDSEAFYKGFAVRHSTFEKDATTHLFRDGHKELTPGEYLLPFETLYLRVDVPEGYTMQDYVFDEIEQSWKPNTPKSYICPEHDFHIIAMGEQMKVIKNWSPLASISTFGFRATDNQIEFAGSTDGGTMSYILDDTDVTKFTIEYTNTAGEGNVYLIIGDRQYDVISGQLQTYSVSGSVKLEFLNMEEMNNKDSAFLFSTKLKKESSGSILMSEYKYLGNSNSYLDELLANNGGVREPIWGTTKKNVSLEGYTYGKQSNNIYILNCQNGTNSLYACSNKPTVLTVGTGPTKEVQEVTVAFGGYFDAVKEAPATNTLNGCMNMFIAFSSALTEDKIRILSKAVWDFDEACGRHNDFAQ